MPLFHSFMFSSFISLFILCFCRNQISKSKGFHQNCTKMDQHHISHLVLFFSLLLICLAQETQSFPFTWRSSSSAYDTNKDDHSNYEKSGPPSGVAKFSMELPNDPKGIKSAETAQQRLASRQNSCWQNAYKNLYDTCSVIVKDDQKRSRLAWQLSDCFQKDSGRSPFPSCDSWSHMLKCLTKLDESAHKVYLEFYLQTNAICHQLQANAFKIETERLVNDLKKSAELAEEKLHNIEQNSEKLIHNSDKIDQSLTSLDSKTQQVAETSEKVRDQIDVSLKHSNVILEQSKIIVDSQSELQQGQTDMRDKLEVGIKMLHESYEKLGQNVQKLRDEAVEIEKEINRVSNSMSTKMENLQNKADDIGNVAGLSLDRQKQLLEGQSTALEGLDFLTKFQSQALEESRASLQALADFGQKQQEELLRRQEQLQQTHDHLIENSKSILSAQEEFKSKQASMFLALDKLFTLHNAILLESHSIKAFFFYSFVIFLLYMLTSAKQTYGMRARLYLGLCVIFIVEFVMCRFGVDLDQQVWIASKVTLARTSFLVAAAVQLLYSIFTYRDYEVLNHRMLETLIEKVNIIERKKAMPLEIDESCDDINFSTWIDEDLSEEENFCKDPDFLLPEEVAENSVTTSSYSRKYDLRPRHLRQ